MGYLKTGDGQNMEVCQKERWKDWESDPYGLRKGLGSK